MLSILKNIAFFLSIFHRTYAYITYIEVKYPLPGERSAPGSPWPIPQRWIRSEKVLVIPETDSILKTSGNALECDVISEAIKRYNNIIHELSEGSLVNNSITQTTKTLNKVSVKIKVIECESNTYPKLGDDESYTIAIPDKDTENAFIKANTIWGAIRAFETFSQLIYKNIDTKETFINVTKIEDWPRFQHRGLLLDTARHYIPINVLLLNLEAMAYNKMNVFHWHIIDDQSFPFESKIFPNLTRISAYSERHVYSQENIKFIISEARLRGIRVIPEIDTPGHTQSFGRVFPKLLTLCHDSDGVPNRTIYGKHAGTEILNPIENFTYDFFKQFFSEIKDVFADEYIHLGMDEVYYDCWQSNPDILKFMKDMNMNETSELEQYYVKRTVENVKQIGYKYMTWQDPVDNGVQMSNDTIVQLWKDTELVSTFKRWDEYIGPIAKKNYKMVLSSCWYLNYISYGQDWKKYYNCDPHNFVGTTEEKKLIIGGEACLWAEYVDGTNLLSRLWPRASAVAEKLWSSSYDTDNTDNAQFRLDEHRCRMLRRGIPAQPILNGFCGDYEWDIEIKSYDSLKSGTNQLNQSINNFKYLLIVYTLLILINVFK